MKAYHQNFEHSVNSQLHQKQKFPHKQKCVRKISGKTYGKKYHGCGDMKTTTI